MSFWFLLKVFGELLVDSQQLLMVTVGSALQEIGYEIQVLIRLCFGLIFAGKIVLLNLGRGKWSGNRLNEQCLPMKVWYALVWDWIWCFISRREGEHKQIDILTYRLNITLECVCCLLYYSNFKMPHFDKSPTFSRTSVYIFKPVNASIFKQFSSKALHRSWMNIL